MKWRLCFLRGRVILRLLWKGKQMRIYTDLNTPTAVRGLTIDADFADQRERGNIEAVMY
jgi:hypothetical protein